VEAYAPNPAEHKIDAHSRWSATERKVAVRRRQSDIRRFSGNPAWMAHERAL